MLSFAGEDFAREQEHGKQRIDGGGAIMNRGRILEVVLTMIGAILLLIAATGKYPYGFYMVLRLVITVGAVYWAWRVYKEGQQVWTWIFVAVALLLNPFFRIHMQRTQWQPIDLCLGIFLIGWSGYWLLRRRTRKFEIKRFTEKKTNEINEVHQILSDQQKRRLNDQQLDTYEQTRATQKTLTPMLVRFVPSAVVTCVAWVHIYKQIYPYLSERVGDDVAAGLADWLTTIAAGLVGYMTYRFISRSIKSIRRTVKVIKGSRTEE